MNCPNCNSPIENGASFCKNCGTPVGNQSGPSNGNPNVNYNYQQNQNQGQPNYQQPPYQSQPNYQQPYYQGQSGGKAPIARRDIAVAIVLSIVTCGIYGIYWFINLVNDLNVASDTPDDTSGGMVFLLSLVTCGIYGIYWLYQAGKKVSYITNKYSGIASDNSIVYLLLAIFGFGIVDYALIQNELNKIAAN